MASKKHWRKRARRRAHHIEQLERALQDAEAEASEAKILNCRLRLEMLERDAVVASGEKGNGRSGDAFHS